MEKLTANHRTLLRDGFQYGSYIFALFAIGWLLVILYLNRYPSLLAMAFLSFTFGLGVNGTSKRKVAVERRITKT